MPSGGRSGGSESSARAMLRLNTRLPHEPQRRFADAWLTSAGMSMHSLNEEEEQVDNSDEESDGGGGGNKAFLMMMEEEKKLTTIMMNLKKWKRNVVK